MIPIACTIATMFAIAIIVRFVREIRRRNQ